MWQLAARSPGVVFKIGRPLRSWIESDTCDGYPVKLGGLFDDVPVLIEGKGIEIELLHARNRHRESRLVFDFVFDLSFVSQIVCGDNSGGSMLQTVLPDVK